MPAVKAENKGGVAMGREPVIPNIPTYAVATVPSAADHAHGIIYVSNGAAGSPCLAYSNGTNWLRVLIGAAVATS